MIDMKRQAKTLVSNTDTVVLLLRIIGEFEKLKRDVKSLKKHHDGTTHGRMVKIGSKMYSKTTTFNVDETGFCEVKGGE